MSPTRIVIADDHALLRESIVRLLEGAGDLVVVAQASTGEQALELVRLHEPDLVLLDVSMPGDIDGLEAATTIREEVPDVRVVMLTMHDDDATLRRASEAAVDGYVAKTSTSDEVVTAVRAVAGGSAYVSPSIAARMMRLASGNRAGNDMTPREVEILRMLAQGSRIQEIADGLFLSSKTVKNHLTNVYAKLGVETAAQAVATAYREGLVTAD